MKKVLLAVSFLMLFATKSQAVVAVGVATPVVGVGVRVNVAVAVPRPCGGMCGVQPMPMPMPVYGYGTHGAYGYGGGYGYGYGGCYSGYCGPRYAYGSTCGRCHRRVHYAHGRRACGCRGRGGFALAISTPSFGFGLRIW